MGSSSVNQNRVNKKHDAKVAATRAKTRGQSAREERLVQPAARPAAQPTDYFDYIAKLRKERGPPKCYEPKIGENGEPEDEIDAKLRREHLFLADSSNPRRAAADELDFVVEYHWGRDFHFELGLKPTEHSDRDFGKLDNLHEKFGPRLFVEIQDDLRPMLIEQRRYQAERDSDIAAAAAPKAYTEEMIEKETELQENTAKENRYMLATQQEWQEWVEAGTVAADWTPWKGFEEHSSSRQEPEGENRGAEEQADSATDEVEHQQAVQGGSAQESVEGAERANDSHASADISEEEAQRILPVAEGFDEDYEEVFAESEAESEEELEEDSVENSEETLDGDLSDGEDEHNTSALPQRSQICAPIGPHRSSKLPSPLGVQSAPAPISSVVGNQQSQQVGIPTTGPVTAVPAPAAFQSLPPPAVAQTTVAAAQAPQAPQAPPPVATQAPGQASDKDRYRQPQVPPPAQPLTIDDFYPQSNSMTTNRAGWIAAHEVISNANIRSVSGFAACRQGPIKKSGGDFLVTARNPCLNGYLAVYHRGQPPFGGGSQHDKQGDWYASVSQAERDRLRRYIMQRIDSLLPAPYRALVDALRRGGIPANTITQLEQTVAAFEANPPPTAAKPTRTSRNQAANAVPTGPTQASGSAFNAPASASTSNGAPAAASAPAQALRPNQVQDTGLGGGMNGEHRPHPTSATHQPPNSQQRVKRPREEYPEIIELSDDSEPENSRPKHKRRRQEANVPNGLQAPHFPPPPTAPSTGHFTSTTFKHERDDAVEDIDGDEGAARSHKRKRPNGNMPQNQVLQCVPQTHKQTSMTGNMYTPSPAQAGPLTPNTFNPQNRPAYAPQQVVLTNAQLAQIQAVSDREQVRSQAERQRNAKDYPAYDPQRVYPRPPPMQWNSPQATMNNGFNPPRRQYGGISTAYDAGLQQIMENEMRTMKQNPSRFQPAQQTFQPAQQPFNAGFSSLPGSRPRPLPQDFSGAKTAGLSSQQAQPPRRRQQPVGRGGNQNGHRNPGRRMVGQQRIANDDDIEDDDEYSVQESSRLQNHRRE